MARIELRTSESRAHAHELVINGMDVSAETYRGVKLVKVGTDWESQEVGLQVTFAVTELVIGTVDVDPASLLGLTLCASEDVLTGYSDAALEHRRITREQTAAYLNQAAGSRRRGTS